MKIALPEALNLSLDTAGYGSRCLAYLTDVAIRWSLIATLIVLLIAAYSIVGSLETLTSWIVKEVAHKGRSFELFSPWSLVILLIFLVEWSYPVYFEVFQQGATPGKNFFGLRVINSQGLAIDFQSSAIRNILNLVDILPACGVVGMISILSTKNHQRLGDIAAGTVVVYQKSKNSKAQSISTNAEFELQPQLYRSLSRYIENKELLFLEARETIREKLFLELQPLILEAGLGQLESQNQDEILSILLKRVKPAAIRRN